MKRRTILSLEQALSLPYATLRFVQLGWRVIRIEAYGDGGAHPGDPNRYIGATVVDDDRRTYFVAPNVGKEAIAINLRKAEGRALLPRLLCALGVDVFCCNTLPRRYEPLGIDYASLSAAKPDLVWAAISALGPQWPDAPGYDPVLQAMAGYMELTGAADGPPTLAGVPVVDLKAGDELFAGVMRALLERAETGQGQRVDVSMLQAAASWLITTLPLLDFDCDASEVTRCGNEHRKFVPTNVYPTRDGYIYMAIGNDVQWRRLTALPRFAALASAVRDTNEGRRHERAAIHRQLADATAACGTADLARDLAAATIPHAVINDVRAVRDLPQLGERLTTTHTPEGRAVRMPPPAVEAPGAMRDFTFAPKYGEHTRAVLCEAGVGNDEIQALVDADVIPRQSIAEGMREERAPA